MKRLFLVMKRTNKKNYFKFLSLNPMRLLWIIFIVYPFQFPDVQISNPL